MPSPKIVSIVANMYLHLARSYILRSSPFSLCIVLVCVNKKFNYWTYLTGSKRLHLLTIRWHRVNCMNLSDTSDVSLMSLNIAIEHFWSSIVVASISPLSSGPVKCYLVATCGTIAGSRTGSEKLYRLGNMTKKTFLFIELYYLENGLYRAGSTRYFWTINLRLKLLARSIFKYQ